MPNQAKQNKVCSDDLDMKASAKLPTQPTQDPHDERKADSDAAALEPAATVQQQQEGRRPAPSYPMSRYAHLPIGPPPKPIVSRHRRDPPKPKYVRPSRPEIGDIIFVVEGDKHRQPCIRASDLYKGQEAKVVGESCFAFMSPHERLLQIEECDENGQKHRRYVRESEVRTPRVLDG